MVKERSIGLPKVIKKNAIYISAAHIFFTIVVQVVFILSPLIILKITGSAALAGLAASIIWGGRILIVYHSGKLMDRLGRRVVLLFGLGLAGAALIVLIAAAFTSSFALYIAGLGLYGFGVGISQQNRVAMADMFPASRRAEGVGYLFTSSIVGSLIAIPFASLTEFMAITLKLDPWALALLIAPLFIIPASYFTFYLRPDPKEIGERLSDYYPELAEQQAKESIAQNFLNRSSVLYRPVLIAISSSALGWGIMVMMMSLVSLVLHEHGVELTLIFLAVTVHIVGMFALSVPIGRIADKFGRKRVLLAGALVIGVGSLITPLTHEYLIVTIGIFLVGLGWSAINVASTALISDVTHPSKRGRIIGTNDFAIGASALALPFAGGVVIGALGLASLGYLGLLLVLPTLAATLLLSEPTPGKYVH